jgi:signal transducing adaptor molecule
MINDKVKDGIMYANIAANLDLTTVPHFQTTHDTVRQRALELIQSCAFDFRSDPSLGLMNETYLSLRSQGVQFPSPQKPKKETQTELDKQKEEEEFQLALALSLSESESKAQYKVSHLQGKVIVIESP